VRKGRPVRLLSAGVENHLAATLPGLAGYADATIVALS
jgi:hypothetical protein